jgi:hypothetical protein
VQSSFEREKSYLKEIKEKKRIIRNKTRDIKRELKLNRRDVREVGMKE